MGGKHRLKLLIIGALVLHGAAACSRKDEDEERRRLLEASGRAQARQQRIDKQRVRDPEGDLLPSETKVAGYVLPRGFELTRTQPHRWTYDARLPQNKVEEYFDKRLASGTKTKKENSEVEWLRSVEKSDPNAVPGWVQVMPTPSKREWTRIILSEPQPVPKEAPPLVDAQKMQEIMAERRRTAR
jgi:hypothetical protein